MGGTRNLIPFPGKTYDQALSQWNRVTGTTLRCWKVRTTLSKRVASGLPVGSIAWYNGPNPRTPQGNQNEIVGDHPDRLAAEDISTCRELYKAVNGVSWPPRAVARRVAWPQRPAGPGRPVSLGPARGVSGPRL